MNKPSRTPRINSVERGSGIPVVPVTRNASGCELMELVQLDVPSRSAAGTNRSVRGLIKPVERGVQKVGWSDDKPVGGPGLKKRI